MTEQRSAYVARGPYRIAALALLALAVAFLSVDVARVLARLRFDYDLLLWGDDYFMTSALKLAAGVPVYTAVADGNSTVYPPGGAYLHRAVLAPFGLGTSLLANRLLNQLWLAIAVGLATTLAIHLARRNGVRLARRVERTALTLAVFALLGVTVYANPVVDSLHPTNLELVVLAATAHLLARWPELSSKHRWAALVLLPAAALLAKQTAGVAVSVALAWRVYRDAEGSRSRRAATGLLPLAILATTVASLSAGTHGLFFTWAFAVLARHPFDWWKAEDLYAGYFLLFVPSLLTVAVAAIGGLRRSSSVSVDAAWMRTVALPVLYAPLALAALFKTMGGPNNLAVLGFLLVVCAIPLWLAATVVPRARLRFLGVALATAQLVLLYPRRRAPDAHDFDNARVLCDYAARRMQCGERVHLGRGSVCYQRGGVRVPIDRLSSIVEVAVAGRGGELGFFRRVTREEYDVLIVPIKDLLWFGPEFWNDFSRRYRAFFMTQGELENDFWFDGWQGYVSWPMVFFERTRDAGRHHVDDAGMECGGS